jgi:hypothetical protein
MIYIAVEDESEDDVYGLRVRLVSEVEPEVMSANSATMSRNRLVCFFCGKLFQLKVIHVSSHSPLKCIALKDEANLTMCLSEAKVQKHINNPKQVCRNHKRNFPCDSKTQ